MTVVIAVAPAIGPTLGRVILTMLGWRWEFGGCPIALLALTAVRPVVADRGGETRRVCRWMCSRCRVRGASVAGVRE